MGIEQEGKSAMSREIQKRTPMRLEVFVTRQIPASPGFHSHRFILPRRRPLTRKAFTWAVCAFCCALRTESRTTETGQISGSVFTPAQGRKVLCRAPRCRQLCSKEQHTSCVCYWESFSLLICKTKKLVFIFSDENIIFRGNLWAFSWGRWGRELTLNDTKYAFSVNVSALSGCTRHGKESNKQWSNVPTHGMDFNKE